MRTDDFQVPGLWDDDCAIYWIGNRVSGKQYTPEDPHFFVQVERFGANQLSEIDNQKAVPVPCGLLPAIHVGTSGSGKKFSQKNPLYRAHVANCEFEINISERQLLGPCKTWITRDHYNIGKGLFTPCVCIETDRERIVIPVIEIARFYWGTSTRLLQLVVTGQASDPNNLLVMFDDKGNALSKRREGGGLELIVRHYLRIRDAWPISRILVSPHARESVKALHVALLASNMEKALNMGNSERILNAPIFPFVGKTTLKCMAIADRDRKEQRRKPTYLVLQLLECSHPFPEAQLYVSKENEKLSTLGNEAIPILMESELLEDMDEGLLRTLVYHSPTRAIVPKLLALKEKRFSWLADKILHRLPLNSSVESPPTCVVNIKPVSEVSTGVARSNKNGAVGLRVETTDEQLEFVNECTILDPQVARERQPQFELIVDALKFILSMQPLTSKRSIECFLIDWNVVHLDIGSRSKELNLHYLCGDMPSPNTYDSWSLVKAFPTRPRFYQWIEIETKWGIFYILEIEPRSTEIARGNGTYVLSYFRQEHADVHVLSEYIKEIVAHKECRGSKGMQKFGWNRTSVHHTIERRVEDLASSFFKAVMRLKK